MDRCFRCGKYMGDSFPVVIRGKEWERTVELDYINKNFCIHSEVFELCPDCYKKLIDEFATTYSEDDSVCDKCGKQIKRDNSPYMLNEMPYMRTNERGREGYLCNIHLTFEGICVQHYPRYNFCLSCYSRFYDEFCRGHYYEQSL